jgi:DNA-binding NtrC family response regulator
MTSGSRLKILCIDDDQGQLLLTSQLLQRAGYKVITATNGSQALEALDFEPIHLVISDQLLEGMSGAEIARQIKKLYPRTLVALFSGMVEPPEGSEAYTDMFIPKGAEPRYLLEQVALLLSGKAFRAS